MADNTEQKRDSQFVILQSKGGRGLQGYLLFAILGGFVAWMVWGQPEINVDVKAYEDRINKLEMKVDSLHTQNTHLEIKSDSLVDKIASYTNRINNLNTKINVIQKETKAKLDAVNSYSIDELQQFFTDRYRLNKDSIN
jgi:peptidoglycan hydrolase CwlO-like protein|tara:strand:- start:134 stop:550 length:417 start_codon:yes stop_codon:yes gene_type:complete